MAGCRITDVREIDPCASVSTMLRFQVTIDVAEQLKEDVVFRCVFIIDSANPQTDMELESIDVGPLELGVMTFVFESPPPSIAALEASGGASDVGGLYLSALYRGSEFCRVGYFVRHEDPDAFVQDANAKDPNENFPEDLDMDDPPPVEVEKPMAPTDWSRLQRVLSEPCVTRFGIGWDHSIISQPSIEYESQGFV
mmetsp:Transcript_75599/g.210037  ORF Transcript_75599/g.210037 Transcript_75599/m.210037 type:complete len:196 (-) Transcript_75599:341-928(-)